MRTVTANDQEGKLNAHDLCNDYRSKINAACGLALVHHEQDELGATLVIHVPVAGIEEGNAQAMLSERLGKLIAELPAPETADKSVVEQTLDSQKAVVDQSEPKAAKSTRKVTKANDGANTAS